MRAWSQRKGFGIHIDHFIATYGLLAVFLGAVLEGETVAITGGIMAHRQLLVLWQVVLVATSAAFLMDMVFFLLGRRYRTRPRMRRLMARPTFQKALGQIEKNPSWFSVAFRFVPGMRMIGPLALGQSQISAARFAALAGAAALAWGAFYVLCGQAVGHLVALAFGKVDRTEHLLILSAGLLVLVAALRLWRRHRNKAPHPAPD